jgi:hypothetical protein
MKQSISLFQNEKENRQETSREERNDYLPTEFGMS